jgi:hypothetical protein
MTILTPTNLAETLAGAVANRRALRAARHELVPAANAAAEQIARAYEYARDESCEMRGAAMLKHANAIENALAAIDCHLAEMAGLARQAATAVQEFEAKQAKLGRGLKI